MIRTMIHAGAAPLRRLALMAAAILAITGPAHPGRTAEAGLAVAGTPLPLIPPELRPDGQTLLFTATAGGVQIYVSVAEGGGYKWVLEAPLARLRADRGGVTLLHYDGPSWEASDGSKVSRDKDVPVASVPAPDAGNDIPWLLIKVAADPAIRGVLSPVTAVQRVATHGGTAPAAPPVRAGSRVGVPYTATYAFYTHGPRE